MFYTLDGSRSQSAGGAESLRDGSVGAVIHPVPLVVLALAAAWYASRVARLRRRGRTWPAARVASFAVAVVVVGAGTVPELPGFVARSVQDLGLFLVAPAFVVLSGPVTLGLEAGGKGAAVVGRAATGRVGQVVLHPVTLWVLYGTALVALYFTPEYRTGAAHPAIRLLIDLELVLVGWLFAWPLTGPDPKPRSLAVGWRVVMVMLATVYFSILGLAMQSQRQPIAPGVTVGAMHAGGGDLWSSAELISIAATIGVLYEWLFVDLSRARRADRFNAAEDARQLDLWRASRRAAALADLRARESLIVRSRPAGTPRSDDAFSSTRRAPPRRPSDPAPPAQGGAGGGGASPPGPR